MERNQAPKTTETRLTELELAFGRLAISVSAQGEAIRVMDDFIKKLIELAEQQAANNGTKTNTYEMRKAG